MNKKIVYKITFSRNGYTRKDGKKEVVITLTQNGKVVQIGTKIYIYQTQLKNGFIFKHPSSNVYNKYLYKLKNDFERIELELVLSGKQVTLPSLRRHIKDGIRKSMPLSEFVETVNKSSTTRCEKTKASYTTLVKQVNKFQRGTTINDIDVDFINSFIKWSKDNNMSHNTIVGRLKGIRAMVNEAIKRNLIRTEDDPFKYIKIPMMKNREEFLTVNEVNKLEGLKLTGKYKKIRDAFLFSCYTGFRFSDLNSIKNSDIKDIRGNKWIVKKPLKTIKSSNVTVSIPIYSIFEGKPLKLIENEYKGNLERLCHVGNNSTANRILKEVILKSKIDNADKRHITFHCGRHTAATLLLQQSVPMTTIQKILGHTKLSTTQIYAKVNNGVIDNDVKRAFKKRKHN